jgi:hypothetical protein
MLTQLSAYPQRLYSTSTRADNNETRVDVIGLLLLGTVGRHEWAEVGENVIHTDVAGDTDEDRARCTSVTEPGLKEVPE